MPKPGEILFQGNLVSYTLDAENEEDIIEVRFRYKERLFRLRPCDEDRMFFEEVDEEEEEM